MWSYGIGAMIDLPRLSVMVEGLDHWSLDHARTSSAKTDCSPRFDVPSARR